MVTGHLTQYATSVVTGYLTQYATSVVTGYLTQYATSVVTGHLTQYATSVVTGYLTQYATSVVTGYLTQYADGSWLEGHNRSSDVCADWWLINNRLTHHMMCIIKPGDNGTNMHPLW